MGEITTEETAENEDWFFGGRYRKAFAAFTHVGKHRGDGKHGNEGAGETGHSDEGVIFDDGIIKDFIGSGVKIDGVFAKILEFMAKILTDALTDFGLKLFNVWLLAGFNFGSYCGFNICF